MGTSFQRSHDALLHSVPPTLQQATADRRLHQRLLDTHGQVWVSLLWGHCSFLPGPSVYSFVCALPESVSPVLCEFWQLCGGVNGDLLLEGLCHTQACCTQSPCPHRSPLPTRTPGEALRHSGVSGSGGLRVLVDTGMFEPPEHLWRVCGLILNTILPCLPSCWGFSFALEHGVSPHSCSSTT